MNKSLIAITTMMTLIVIQNIGTSNCHPNATSDENEIQNNNEAQAPTITRFHDILVYKKSIPGIRVSNKTRRSSHIFERRLKVLPADESLRHKYFSGKVEDNLAHVKINRLRRNQKGKSTFAKAPQVPPFQLASVAQSQKRSPIMSIVQPNTVMDKERIQDLAEVFRILAKRNGPMLEQMLSLKSAIERLYGIFEFTGVARMPAAQRDEAVRKIIEKSLKIDMEKAAKVVIV